AGAKPHKHTRHKGKKVESAPQAKAESITPVKLAEAKPAETKPVEVKKAEPAKTEAVKAAEPVKK
ncbi:MAG TPA: hypothetical protein PKH67_00550, partial [Rhodocyclaceae bacterium]|nr:hypothetical protein [Rhodocyclaceae bacterium]